MHEINKIYDEIKSIQYQLEELERKPVDEAIEKIADELVNGLCPLDDSHCPSRTGTGICRDHWVNYLHRVVEK